MARLILDTSVVIAAEKQGVASLLFSDDDDLAVAAITIAEVMLGVELAEGRRREQREDLVKSLLQSITVEDYDLKVAQVHAALMADTHRRGCPRGKHDMIVAATARARGREVVTLDRRGFDDLPKVKVHAR
jgi:tRNA(fMet)-specific endonuclease VapC